MRSNGFSPIVLPAALAAALALAGCGGAEDNAQNAAANDADPALTSALEDQILVDPTLAQQSNANAVRTPDAPPQAQYPAEAGAQAAAAGMPSPACLDEARFHYDPAWAQRLAPAFSVYPGAKLVEAAGNNSDNCRTRIATFTTGDPFERVLDWYHTKAVRAGYSSEQQIRGEDRVLAGANEATGGAFYLIVTPKSPGAEVALITNSGR